MSVINFITDGSIERLCDRRQRRQDVLRENLRRRIEVITKDVEDMTDICRDLRRAGGDVSEELNETETTVRALLLAVLLLKREAGLSPQAEAAM